MVRLTSRLAASAWLDGRSLKQKDLRAKRTSVQATFLPILHHRNNMEWTTGKSMHPNGYYTLIIHIMMLPVWRHKRFHFQIYETHILSPTMSFLFTVDLLWNYIAPTDQPTAQQSPNRPPCGIPKLHRTFAPSLPIRLLWRLRSLRLLFIFIISDSAWPSQNAWRIWTGTKLTDPSLQNSTRQKTKSADPA